MGVERINGVSSVQLVKSTDSTIEKRKKTQKSNEVTPAVEKKMQVDFLSTLCDRPIPQLPAVEEIQKKVSKGLYKIEYEQLSNRLIALDNLWYKP